MLIGGSLYKPDRETDYLEFIKNYANVIGFDHRPFADYEFMRIKDHALNAGCMINKYTPASFNELVRNNEVFKQDQ